MKLVLVFIFAIFKLIEGQTYQTHTYICEDGYWNNQRCVPCVDQNGICPEGSFKITSCKSGYYLASLDNGYSMCKACPKYCSQCQEPKVGMSLICTSCQDNSSLIEGTCQHIPNCQVINLTLGSCMVCQDGYYLNEQQQCIACDSSCTTCIAGHICSTCTTGYSFLNQSFFCTKCDLYTTTQNCAACIQSDSIVSCTKCMEGYYLNTVNSTCQACPQNCQRCAVQADSIKCLACNSDSNILQDVSGNCLSCSDQVPNCSSCVIQNNTLKCVKCMKTFYYNSSDNTCKPCKNQSLCNCSKSSCTDDEVTIVQCPQSMNLFESKCEPLSANPNCDSFLSKTTCQICEQGYQLLGDKTCQKNTDQNCKVFKNNESKCVFCTQQSSTQYILVEGQCIQQDANCLEQVTADVNYSGGCKLFHNKYYYDDTGVKQQCQKDDFCAFLEIDSSKKITCNTSLAKDSKYLIDGTCDVFDEQKSGCLVWEKGTTNCAICYNQIGFYLDSTTKKCGYTSNNCLQVQSGTTKCSKCQVSDDQYFVELEGTCISCSDQSSAYYLCQTLLQQSVDKQLNLQSDQTQNNNNILLTLNIFLFILLTITF